MAVARQNEVLQRLDKLEKEVEALREYKVATAFTFPIIFTIIIVGGVGSFYILSERMTETTMQLNMRFGDVNNRIDDVNRDMNRRIDNKLDRLLLK